MSKETKIKIVEIVAFSIVGLMLISAAPGLINQIQNLIISIG
jgi:hypothetical protein